MSALENMEAKVQDQATAAKTVRRWQDQGLNVVFTNGCFDILHYGHLRYLAQARDLGQKLVIGINSAASVKRLKGEHRPIQDETTRMMQLAALAFVDLVVPFETDTPLELLEALQPDFLVKGGDYDLSTIVGADFIQSIGGTVLALPFVDGYSTTAIEQRIKVQ